MTTRVIHDLQSTFAKGLCLRLVFGALVLIGLGSCSASDDSNAGALRQQFSGNLSFAMGMSDYWYTGTPLWCSSGTTSWGTYYHEGGFETDNSTLSPIHGIGGISGLPLSEDDRTTTYTYLALTLFKAHYVRMIPGYRQRCYDFDAAATTAAHVTYRHGVGSRYSLWAGDPRYNESPNWDIVIPIGKIEVDNVTRLSEYKMNVEIEYTCRSYQIDLSYHGIVPALDGRQFYAQASLCLDPRDNKWHEQQFRWGRNPG